MKNFLKKQREVIAIIAYFGTIIALVFFVINPLFKSINGVNDQIQEEGMLQEIMRQNIDKLPNTKQQYETLQKDEKLNNALLDKNDAIVPIEKLEKLAEDSGNKISISIKDEAAQKAIVPTKKTAVIENSLTNSLPVPDYLQMKISIIGNYNTIVNFIGLLENFEYYCDIVGIQISAKAEEVVPDSGALNPFNRNKELETKKTPENVQQEEISASLDVVFYIKK